MRKKASEEQWRKFGARTYNIQEEIMQLMVDMQPFISKRSLHCLLMARGRMSDFKSIVSGDMEKQNVHDLDIFYPYHNFPETLTH